MARRYRMTPARRAAIKKAQAASARKRRRRNIAMATTAGVVAVTTAAAGGHYGRKQVYKRRYKKAHQEFLRRATGPQLALPAGPNGRRTTRLKANYQKRARNSVMFDAAGNPRGNKNGLAAISKGQAKMIRKRSHKIKVGKTAQVINRSRPNYDASRRADYKPSVRHLRYKEKGY